MATKEKKRSLLKKILSGPKRSFDVVSSTMSMPSKISTFLKRKGNTQKMYENAAIKQLNRESPGWRVAGSDASADSINKVTREIKKKIKDRMKRNRTTN